MHLSNYKSHDRLLLSVDCIILGFDGKQLNALLIKRDFEPEKGKWSLMGGFISKDENAEQAAARVLNQLTGLADIYLEQLHCFSEVDRDSAGRVVSIAFSALIKIDSHDKQLLIDHNAKWFPITNLPKLIFDHKAMVQLAIENLQQKAITNPLGFELLPAKFTLPQLQSLYESIYQVTFDKRNFSRRIHSLKILKKLNEKEKLTSRKGAFYFTFDKKRYTALKRSGTAKLV